MIPIYKKLIQLPTKKVAYTDVEYLNVVSKLQPAKKVEYSNGEVKLNKSF